MSSHGEDGSPEAPNRGLLARLQQERQRTPQSQPPGFLTDEALQFKQAPTQRAASSGNVSGHAMKHHDQLQSGLQVSTCVSPRAQDSAPLEISSLQ
jgi:hypothetical protein